SIDDLLATPAKKPAIVKLEEPKPLPMRVKPPEVPLTKWQSFVGAILFVLILLALLWYLFG
ncbi:MAG TPA: hypothetical protein VF403_26025, partial [Kofleriaceae bacterium]